MNEFVLYNLKAGACLAGFYLFYKLLLSRETLHRFNRIVLLLLAVLSFVLPLCVVTIERELPPAPVQRPVVSLPVEAVPMVTAAPPVQEAADNAVAVPFAWDTFMLALLLAGAMGALAWSAWSLAGVVRLIRRGRHELLDGRIVLVRTRERVTPFSWLRYIVMCDRDYDESGREIIAHERAHIRLRHSLDLMLTDLCSCLQWFNPAMWLLRQELRAIHEYEADEAVLREGADPKSYQMLLIKKAVGGRWYSVANSLNHSNLKSRITMMLRKRSSRWAAAKALLLLPLVGVALGAFARTAYVVADDKVTQNSPEPQGFSGWMGVRADGEGSMVFELEGQGDPYLGALGLMSWYSSLKLGEESAKNVYVRELMALSFEQDAEGNALRRPLCVVDGKVLNATEPLPDGDRVATIELFDPAVGKAAYGNRGEHGVVLITTKAAGAPNPQVRRAMEQGVTDESGNTVWFSGRTLFGTAAGGLSMSGAFSAAPLNESKLDELFDPERNEMDEVPDERTFVGRMAVRLEGDERAVATIAGYRDGMMAVAGELGAFTFYSPKFKDRSEELRKLSKIAYRLSRTAAASPVWMAYPMPYTLVDGQRIERMEQVPDADRMLRVEVLGRRRAQESYGEAGAYGAVLITTKPQGSSSLAEVDAVTGPGVVKTSSGSEDGTPPKAGEKGVYATAGLPTVEMDKQFKAFVEKLRLPGGLDDEQVEALWDEFIMTGELKSLEGLGAAAIRITSGEADEVRPTTQRTTVTLGADQAPSFGDFSGRISIRMLKNGSAYAVLSGKGDGMMAVASQLAQDHMPLCRIAYRLSCAGTASSAWNSLPMPYTLVNGKRIESADRVPDTDRIRSIEILDAERAIAAYGEAGANGAVLIVTRKRGVSTEAAIAAEKEKGAAVMSAGQMTFGLSIEQAAAADTGASVAGGPVQVATAASSGTPVAAERRAYRMEYRMSDGDEPVQAMTLMVNGDTVRTMRVDTLRYRSAEEKRD